MLEQLRKQLRKHAPAWLFTIDPGKIKLNDARLQHLYKHAPETAEDYYYERQPRATQSTQARTVSHDEQEIAASLAQQG